MQEHHLRCCLRDVGCIFKEDSIAVAESNAKSAYEKAVGMKYRWAEIKTGFLPQTGGSSGRSEFVG